MKTSETNTIVPLVTSGYDGCQHIEAPESLKMQLRSGMGLSTEKFSRKLSEIVGDKNESTSHKVFAIHNLKRVQTPEAEDSLIRIVSEKDTRLSFPALKTLGITGTEKSFDALNRIKSLPFKSLERQKDFAALFIGYRLQLKGTDKILNRLLEDAPSGKKLREVPLRFQNMKPDEIETVLKQSEEKDQAVHLSRKTAFSLEAGGQTFYFLFTPGFEDPAGWEEALKKPQVAGLLFRKEKKTSYTAQHYIVLATPTKDHVQLNIFKRNGELFMQAKVVYNREKNSFMVSNTDHDQSKTSETILPVNGKSSVTINLSYIRHQKKKKAEPIKPTPVT